MNTSKPSSTDPNNGKSSDGRIQVTRVTITPWRPVLDDNGDSRDYRLNLELYNQNHPQKKNPCTIRLGEWDARKLTFEFNFDKIDVEDVTLSVDSFETNYEDKNKPKILSETMAFVSPSDGGPGFIAWLNSPSDIVPWGLQGTITWKFTVMVKEKEPIEFRLSHHLELYAISTSVGAKPAHIAFQRQGIPRKALELYILASKAFTEDPVTTFKEYIAAIANVVHGYTGHIYDVWDGSPFYTSGGSPGSLIIFNINKWAKNIVIGGVEHGQESTRPMVNCFDQTAAVWAGICLGLTDEDAKKLVWYWAMPFGFIRGTKLVGWHGDVNNGYFKGDSASMFVKEALSSDRWGYWTHVFLAFDGMVIDATCGPIKGNLSLEEYLKTVIDHEAGKASKNLAWKNNIENDEQEQIIIKSGGARVDTLEPIEDGVSELDSQFWVDRLPYRSAQEIPKPQSTGTEKLIIFPSRYRPLLMELVRLMEQGVNIVDSAENTQDYKESPSSGGKTHIYWRVARRGVGSILINVYISEDEASATECLKTLCSSSELPSDEILKAVDGKPNHYVGTRSGSGRRIWRKLNVVVSIVGLSSSEDLQKFVGTVEQYLKVDHPVPTRRVSILDVTIKGAGASPDYKCKVGDVIKVTVTAEHGYGFELGFCKNGCLFALWVDKPNISPDDLQPHYSATFHFLARLSGDEEFSIRVYDSDFGRYRSRLIDPIRLKISEE